MILWLLPLSLESYYVGRILKSLGQKELRPLTNKVKKSGLLIKVSKVGLELYPPQLHSCLQKTTAHARSLEADLSPVVYR